MNRRYDELDSIRGIAALSVMVGHFIIVFPSIANHTFGKDQYWLANLFKYSPMRMFWSGHEAVILFFILSGFVLSLPFYHSKRPFDYPSYLVKRICRIYIPYIIAVGMALLLKTVFYTGKVEGLSKWFNDIWSLDITWDRVAEHIMLLGYFRSNIYDPVLWSLVHEMRISLIFPLLMFFILRFNWKWTLSFGTTLAYVSVILHAKVRASGEPHNYFLTTEYIMMFIIGALLAKHKNEICSWFSGLAGKYKWLLLGLAVVLYTSKWTFYGIRFFMYHFFNDLFIAVASSVFIITALSSKKISGLLLKKPIHFVGEISYSLYLYHCLVLFSMIHALHEHLPVAVILILAVAVSLLVSAAAYKYIEQPAMKLGRNLAGKIRFQDATPSPGSYRQAAGE